MAIAAIMLFFVTCFLYMYIYAKRTKEKEPPLFSGALPLIGHSYMFVTPKDGKSLWRLWSNTAVECWNNGGVIKIQTVWPPLTHYVIGEPDSLLAAANNTTKHYFYKVFRKHIGDGLLVTKDELHWRHHRRQMNPAFTARFVDSLMEVFNGCGRSLCQTWAFKVGEPFEHLQSVGEVALAAVLGDIGKYCNVSIKDYVDAVSTLDRAVAVRLASLPLHSDFLYFLTKDGREYIRVADYVSREGRKIIKTTRERLQKTGDENRNYKNVSELKTVVDYLIEFAEFDDQELLDEVNIVLAAGHTTTASSLTSLFMLLGSHHEVQEKLYEELKEVFGTSNRDVTTEDLLSLPYLDAVVKESLRLYPPAPVALRYSDKKVVLKNYTVPANRFYVLHIYAANRHPVWGEDRMEFRPERWLDPKTLPPQHAFATFSLGKRNCIGKLYAKVSIKVIVAHIIRRYRVFADISKYEVQLEFLIKPASGGIIRLEERNSSKDTNKF